MPDVELSATTWVWLTVLALPLLVTMVTAFAKTTVVLGALRVGLGIEAIFSLPVVLAVAAILTAVIMAPTAEGIAARVDAAGGIEALRGAGVTTWLDVLTPLREFLERHASASELSFFADLQGREPSHPLVLIPAFLVTELTEAFAMAVVILVPLVLVDLIVAQVLVLLGLVNQPPALLTVPAKLLLFLAVGGWDVVVLGLVEGYA